MKKAYFVTFCLVAAACCSGAESPPDFERYRVILDKKPFGEAPSPESLQAPLSPSESFAKSLRMSALLEVEDGGIRVGLVDLQNNKNFFLGVGDTEEGIELVSADYDNEEAVLRKGPEMAVIKLQSGEIQPLTQAEQQARLNAPPPQSRRLSYAERRLMRQQQRQQEPPPQPKYTGEQLEQHLRDYQMEVIRQGLPPLPIPLTPEMDAQLVQEGVLPPQQ
jgi:hypothetical protein